MIAITATSRYFGRCTTKGCKHRGVIDVEPRLFGQHSNAHRCDTHRAYPLDWSPLAGKVNTEKECGSRCMASTGPSCSCQCGGENHGANHVH